MKDTAVTFDFDKIRRLKVCREEVAGLMHIMAALEEPMLDDVSLLPSIYDAYLNVFRRRGCPEKAALVYNRKKFLLVALYLYSPRTLVGDRTRVGLRKELANLFGLATGTAVSDNFADIVFYYESYRDFRRDVDLIFNEIVAVLGDILPL